MEDFAGLPAEVEQAAEFRYRNPIVGSRDMVLAISQSGETADTLAAVREAVDKGSLVAGEYRYPFFHGINQYIYARGRQRRSSN